ncbi:ATP-binding cassette domain-containing protein, partial [Saccharothrix algeriensis]
MVSRPSGAGKSTLGRLIAGVDRPRSGSVTVGGVPVADLPPDRLREQVVLVTQDHHVFQESLRDNLLIVLPTATDADLEQAGRADRRGRELAPRPAGRSGHGARRAGQARRR